MIVMENVDKFYTMDRQRRYILRQQSMHFQSGYSYGLLGVNGAGKSTTVRLLAGLELPNAGTIRRDVRVSWPLGFASGFNPLMSGRENVKFVARAYGEDAGKALDFVADFSELGAFLDQPVKTYSSGMLARLAFGLSMAVEFDCYLIDEVVSVGDARFQQRCEDIFETRRARSNLILVSHDMGLVSRFCDVALVLVDGELRPFANVDAAISAYMRLNK
jgi:capsular polysaccharide transport system ATP-binding protein